VRGLHDRFSRKYSVLMFGPLCNGLQVEHMISEKNILSSLDHPFIVRLSGTFQGKCCHSCLLSSVLT
jgi:hypothetical protein